MICDICPHRCNIPQGGKGLCRARTNEGGKIISAAYGKLTSIALDPIEKKPLARFHPGSMILSAGSYGCNMRCAFCQNWQIACSDGSDIRLSDVPPQALVAMAKDLVHRGNIGIAYTYNEPLVNFEYVRDCSILAKNEGLYNVLVTNAMINPKPFSDILEYTDAANIDLKAFSPDFYRREGGDLATVMQNIVSAAGRIHVELTTLIIEGSNDSDAEMEAQCRWIAGINPDMPLHLSRFFPNHKMRHIQPTSHSTIYRLKQIADKYLKYVYPGNM